MILFSSTLLKMIPARKPSSPQQNICQGVQGPCCMNTFNIRRAKAPVRNPASGPKAMPVMITKAVPG